MTTATANASGIETLERLGTWRAQESPGTASALFAGEGRLITGRRQTSPQYNGLFREAMSLYTSVLSGSRMAALRFQEAMSTSDFPLLFGDIIDRQLLGTYQTLPMNWSLTARVSRVRDFRNVKRFTVDGAESVLPAVGQGAEYTAAALTEGKYEYAVGKYGRRIPILWETLVNDDLDSFADMPGRLARAARRTEERFATALYVDASGPNSTYFSVGNSNLVTGNPALNITGLQTALLELNSQTDTEGNPIYIGQYVLEVPPALEVVANNLLNAVQIFAADGGGDGTGNNQLQINNWLAGKLRIKVNPWLPLIDATGNKNSTWYVWASPTEGRPAMEVGRLIGHESPQLFQKSPNAVRVGSGGLVDPMAGDFDTDSLDWKVRMVIGGTMLDPKMAVVSTGAGS